MPTASRRSRRTWGRTIGSPWTRSHPPTAGGRSCAARSASCKRRGLRSRVHRCGSAARSRGAAACRPRPRSRWRSCSPFGSWPARPRDGDRNEIARLCSRIENEWVGAADGPARPARVALRRAWSCGADRLPLADDRSGRARPRRLRARDARLRRGALARRRRRLQRAPARVRRGVRAARDPDAARRDRGDGRGAARAAAAPSAPRRDRKRARRACGRGAGGR